MTKNTATALAVAGLCFVFFGCETRDCLKWRTIYATRQVCTSYSDTGHCRAYSTEPYNYDVCDEYAPEPAPEAKTEG